MGLGINTNRDMSGKAHTTKSMNMMIISHLPRHVALEPVFQEALAEIPSDLYIL